MDMNDVPLLKKKVLTEKITVAVEPEMKHLWDELKSSRGIDLPEVTRRFLADTLPDLKRSSA